MKSRYCKLCGQDANTCTFRKVGRVCHDADLYQQGYEQAFEDAKKLEMREKLLRNGYGLVCPSEPHIQIYERDFGIVRVQMSEFDNWKWDCHIYDERAKTYGALLVRTYAEAEAFIGFVVGMLERRKK